MHVAATGRLKLSPSDRAALADGARRLGVELDEAAIAALALYADLIAVWSPKVNLISCRDGRELVERHLLDALAMTTLPPPGSSLVDLGSGAGLPGIPLAIVRPDLAVTLVESRRRRASFLREVRRKLALSNVRVLEERAEARKPEVTGEVVTCRAVWTADKAVRYAGPWVRRPGGMLCIFTSIEDAGLVTGAEGLEVVERREYRIGQSGSRMLVVLQAVR
jgi:16S rRNA (guanine527-N7)-methyltransferase